MKKNSNKILIIVIAVLLLAILGGVAYLYFGGYFNKKIEVPDFSSMTKEEMKTWIGENKLEGEQYEIRDIYDERIEEGKLVSQSLSAGSILGEEELVLSYSLGKDPNSQFELPVAWKLTKENLQKWLDMKSFTDVTYEYVIDADHKAGDVLRISKSGYVSRSTPILVTVAADINDESLLVTVPDFSSYTKTQINAWAESNMITVYYAYDLSKTVEQGKVLRQSEKAGTEIKPLSSITITISDGKGITLENLVGMTRAQASAWASENSLKFSYTQEYSETVPEGQVISMSPKAGNTVAENSTVTVVVSKGKRPSATLTGDYVGKTETEFLNYLKSFEKVNLRGSLSSERYSEYPAGSIVSYDSSKTYYEGDSVSYVRSLGSFDPSSIVDGLNGKTLDQIYAIVNDHKSKGANITFSYTEVVNDSIAEGVSYGCSVSGTTISCNIAKQSSIEVPNFIGKTLSEAQSLAQEAGLSVAQGESAYNDTYAADTIYRQSYDPGVRVKAGTVITVNLSMGPKPVETAYVTSPNMLRGYQGDTAEITMNNLMSGPFSAFTNVSYNIREDEDYGPGVIVSISVDPGNYPINEYIVITISKGYPN